MVGVVRHRESGRELMEKRYRKDVVSGDGEWMGGEWRRALESLLMIESAFVVKLVDFFEDDLFVSVIVELCPSGTLHDEIGRRKTTGKSFSEDVWIC